MVLPNGGRVGRCRFLFKKARSSFEDRAFLRPKRFFGRVSGFVLRVSGLFLVNKTKRETNPKPETRNTKRPHARHEDLIPEL